MMDISKRLSVEGPDQSGEYELCLTDCDEGSSSHWIDRSEADRLIEALKPASSSDARIAPMESGKAIGSAPESLPSSASPAPASGGWQPASTSKQDALIQRWRDQANRSINISLRSALKQCADELAQVLAGSPLPSPPSPPPDKS